MNGIPYLSPDETREFIDTHPYTVILDIRTAREHREQRIPGSINLDFFELSPRSIGWLLPDKSRSVLVYCRAGLHSRSAV
ncbi:MAG: rhodanese-like domain-containing protein, partial [Angelakisella sp.]